MIYLDNASTSWPKLDSVKEECSYFLDNCPGSYKRTFEKEDRVSRIRKKALSYFAASEAKIVFVPSATIAMNVLIHSFCGSEIITTNCEHHCVYRTLNGLGVNHKIVDYFDKEEGEKIDKIFEAISPETRLVIMNHGSNVTGDVYNVSKVGQELKKRGICFAVDISQTAGCEDISMDDFNCDVLIGTSHKHLHSITGTGFLVYRDTIDIGTFYYGGTGKMSGNMFQPIIYPDNIEAGTMNLMSIFAFDEAISEITKEERKKTRMIESELVNIFKSECKNIKGVSVINTPVKNKTGVVSFNVKDFDPTMVVAPYLWSKSQILVRPGMHCAPMIHKALGTNPLGTVRMSVSKFTTKQEIYRLLEVLEQLCKENI